ncbi:DUF3124 domain-containing protein [Abyssalbus ytuae]|uniref:DUF3124 domain-containing protein n=1 Tax=Abyssalbus ytuae TaxID=2926907 RepID=A0A9E6ZNJ8_9FLAO|nr:DUF3124 domain-containing protein [Abyssalbus ytuae]UOB17645.1 DUF3124 domain-containing protein [Abyssalbus ytuae]
MYRFFLVFAFIILLSCKEEKEYSSVNLVNWEKRKVNLNSKDSLQEGSTYLSVYSQIYSLDEHRTHDLTATVSIRNINKKDSVFIVKAEYFDTHGNSIRTYFDYPIYIQPLETVEIIIDEVDKEGGTGANFIFDWKVKQAVHEPYIEGIMISTSGQQGLSFTTQGIKIN